MNETKSGKNKSHKSDGEDYFYEGVSKIQDYYPEVELQIFRKEILCKKKSTIINKKHKRRQKVVIQKGELVMNPGIPISNISKSYIFNRYWTITKK